MSSELKTGIEWLAIFSKERREQRRRSAEIIRYCHPTQFPRRCRPDWCEDIEKYRKSYDRRVAANSPGMIERMRDQNGLCYLCCKEFEDTGGLIPSRDHVVPKKLGGVDSLNILIAHLICNNLKDIREPTACELLYRDAIFVGMGAEGDLVATEIPDWLKAGRKEAACG